MTDRPVGPRSPPGGRDRRLGPADAGRVPLLGARGRRLRPRAGRRPGGGRPAVLGVGAGRSRGRRRPPLRPALAADRGLPRPPRPARAPVPQRHAPRVLRRLGRRHGADLPRGPRGAGDARRALRPRPRRQRVEPQGARGARGDAHRRPAHLPRLRPLPRGAEPRSSPAAGGRPDQPAVRRPPGARTRSPRTSSASPAAGSASSRPTCASSSSGSCPGAARTSTRCRRSPTRRASRRRRSSSPATSRTTSCWPATRRRGSSCR